VTLILADNQLTQLPSKIRTCQLYLHPRKSRPSLLLFVSSSFCFCFFFLFVCLFCFSPAVDFSNLTQLNLSDNPLGDSEVEKITQMMTLNQSLAILRYCFLPFQMREDVLVKYVPRLQAHERQSFRRWTDKHLQNRPSESPEKACPSVSRFLVSFFFSWLNNFS